MFALDSLEAEPNARNVHQCVVAGPRAGHPRWTNGINVTRLHWLIALHRGRAQGPPLRLVSKDCIGSLHLDPNETNDTQCVVAGPRAGLQRSAVNPMKRPILTRGMGLFPINARFIANPSLRVIALDEVRWDG